MNPSPAPRSRALPGSCLPSSDSSSSVYPKDELIAGLLVAVGDAPAVQVVRGELDLHSVPREDANVVATHLARNVAEDLVVVVQLYAEHRGGQRPGELARR